MIMRTENAVAAEKPRSRLPSSRRKAGASWSRRAIAPASNTLMDLESSSRDGDAGIQTRKGYTVDAPNPRRRHDPSIVTALECSGPHSTTERAGQILANPVGTGARKVREGPNGYGRN